METSTVLEEIKKGKAEIKELKAQIAAKVQANFHKLAVEVIFNKYPEIKCFGWTQYTPYFNDGEPCYFRANTSYPHINGYESGYDGATQDTWGYYGTDEDEGAINVKYHANQTLGYGDTKRDNPDYRPECVEMEKAVKDFLNLFDEEDYESMFDDGYAVCIRRSGAETTEIDHD
jgi:hypothetical protein